MAWYTVLRYRTDPFRDECKNIAVVVVSDTLVIAENQYAIKYLPVLERTPLLAFVQERGYELRESRQEGIPLIDVLRDWIQRYTQILIFTEPVECILHQDSAQYTAVLLYDVLVK